MCIDSYGKYNKLLRFHFSFVLLFSWEVEIFDSIQFSLIQGLVEDKVQAWIQNVTPVVVGAGGGELLPRGREAAGFRRTQVDTPTVDFIRDVDCTEHFAGLTSHKLITRHSDCY